MFSSPQNAGFTSFSAQCSAFHPLLLIGPISSTVAPAALMALLPQVFIPVFPHCSLSSFKGTVQRDLRGVKNNTNR